jgi:hypothetical protein
MTNRFERSLVQENIRWRTASQFSIGAISRLLRTVRIFGRLRDSEGQKDKQTKRLWVHYIQRYKLCN